jgi:hypothetical protein
MEDSYIEYIRSTREKALQIAKNLSNEYEKMLDRIYDMFYYDILKEDMPKWLRGASPERLKVLKEKLKRSPLISELGKFIGLTGPNEVDINILYIIEDILKNRIIIPYLYYGDPNYEMNLENLVKGLRLLSDVHPYLLDLALRVYHNRLSLPNFNQSMREVRELMYRTNQNVDEETLMFLAKKEAILRCVKNTVRGLFENLDEHQRLIEEGNYLDGILERYCK